MSYRLTRIYTRKGDHGMTGLADGSRLDKDAPRIEALGTVDELNSAVGVLLSHPLPMAIREPLQPIQHQLFDIGGELAIPGQVTIKANDVALLEEILDSFNSELPPLTEFILPAGGAGTAACHLARTICRRAERRLYTLSRHEVVNPDTLAYLNRLSDLLFVMARVIVRHEQGHEICWQPALRRNTPEGGR
jgi:cob(I)alamin adenosyltransferase